MIKTQWSIPALAARFQAKFSGSADTMVTHLCTLEEGETGGLSFFSNPKYTKAFYQTKASVVLVFKDFKPITPVTATCIAVADPYACFYLLVEELYQQHQSNKMGIEFPSYIGEAVTIGADIYRGAFSYIGNYVTIGKNVKIYPHVYIGDHTTIGDDTILYSGVKIAPHTVIGNRCIIHANAVIGSAGFGFTADKHGVYKRIPSIGHVLLGNDVEIGAHAAIDAATVGKTTIAEGTKVDNLVQIAHNVQIGKHSGIAAQVGIAGSTKVGAYAKLGGQTGIAGHLHLGDHVTTGGQTGISRSFPKGSITLLGAPAFTLKHFLACYARFKQLAQPKKN